MRRWMVVACLAAISGCGGGPTAPTPDFVGSYTFIVEASSVCQLPVSRYDWELIATSGGGSAFRLTLPAGDNTLSLSVSYVTKSSGRGRSSSTTSLNVSIGGRTVPFGDELTVTITGQAKGTASVAPDGRGQIVDGTLSGTISLASLAPGPSPSPKPRPTPTPSAKPLPMGSCTAADHKFTLTPR